MRQVADPNVTIDHYPETWACGLALTAHGDAVQRAPGVRSARAAAVDRHRASGVSLPLWQVRRGNPGAVSRGGHGPGAIAPPPGGAICSTTNCCPRTGWPPGRSVRGQAGGGDPCPDEPKLRGALLGVRRSGGRAREAPRSSTWTKPASRRRTQWLHIACTVWLTFYRISPRRGSLLFVGIVVHDHWKPYYTMEGVLHALPITCANSRR